MGKDWKKKVSDFFFYEYEEEVEVEIEEDTSDVQRQSVKRQVTDANRAVHAKIAYQYPKKKQTPFRFPVIPDADEKQLAKKKRRKLRRTTSKINQEIDESRLIYGYRQTEQDKELDNIPAYLRRKNKRIEKEEVRTENDLIERKNILDKHTRPDELDRVFRKRDGLLDEATPEDKEQKTKPIESDTRVNVHSNRLTPLSEHTSVNQQTALNHRTSSYQQKSTNQQTPLNQQTSVKIQTPAYKKNEIAQNTVEPFVRGEPIVDSEKEPAYESQDKIERHRETTEMTTNEQNIAEQIAATQIDSEQILPKQPSFSSNYGESPVLGQMHMNVENDQTRLPGQRDAITSDIAENDDIPMHLLNDPIIPTEDDSDWLREQQLLLEQTLKHFKIKASIVNVTQGPAVTRFEVQPALGVKVSRIKNLTDDIKLNMSARDIRIEAPIPGKNTIGIEVPNLFPQVVSLQEIIESEPFQSAISPLTVALGLSIDGEPLITNIGKMPHGLIAGATGSGKSVCINTVILSILYKAHFDEVKLMLIDPKMVELTPYNGIPHLISPVITDPKAATMALKWAVDEMEARYEKFVEAGVRNIVRYNEKIVKQHSDMEKMPYIVIIIDELADLMMVSPQDVEDAICRIAQKARACGIHLILATQRPSVDVITGLIKANIPTRIAFSVSSQVDSRTIIDTNGAEKLLGKGDMLFVENGSNKNVRLQGPFVSDEEIERVANYVRQLAEPNYLFEQEQLLIEVDMEEEDELINEVISFVLTQNQVSTSLLQRRFRIGYNRAARLIDTLELKGIISAQNGSKPREVLASKSQMNEIE